LTKEDILERINLGVDSAIKLFMRNGVEMRLLRELAASDLETPGVEEFLAAMPNTPSSILNTLLQRGRPAVVQILAQNVLMLPKIAASEDSAVRVLAAQSRKLPPTIALQLVNDSAIEVRLALAHNPVIPPNIQLKLSKDCVSFVRLALLDNKKLDEEFQIGLGDDCDTLVHACALCVPHLSPACMRIWAEFDEELGQLALAGRSDLPPPIVQMLCKSRFDSVRLRLLQKQKLEDAQLKEFALSGDEQVKLVIASREELSEELLAVLWNNGDCSSAVRLKLAASPALSDAIALELLGRASSSDHELLQTLALNPSEHLEQTRQQLLTLGSSYLCKLLLANPQATHEPVLSALIQSAPEEALSHLVYRRIDCSQVTDAARERLRNATLPSVRALA
jgi:hypothetical protein